jgi:hypothetical protein
LPIAREANSPRRHEEHGVYFLVCLDVLREVFGEKRSLTLLSYRAGGFGEGVFGAVGIGCAALGHVAIASAASS